MPGDQIVPAADERQAAERSNRRRGEVARDEHDPDGVENQSDVGCAQWIDAPRSVHERGLDGAVYEFGR
jgi:hypothetical protein